MSAELRELVAPSAAEGIVLAAAALICALGLAGGAVLGLVRGPFMPRFLAGVAVALLGPLLWVLWLLYNAVQRAFGLDSAAGLLLNLLIFVAAGTAVGFCAGRLRRRLADMHKEA